MQNLSLMPVYLVDVIGSILMVIFASVAFYYSYNLMKLQPKKVLWLYIFNFCLSLIAFALSRGFGHIMQFMLLATGNRHVWKLLSPYSGGLNTATFIAITTITIYFFSMRTVIERIKDDANKISEINEDLLKTQNELKELNLGLERRIEERSRLLLKSEEKFRRLFENSQDMIFFCEENIGITDINQTGISLLGFTVKDTIIHRELSDFFAERMNWHQFRQKLSFYGHVRDFEVNFVNSEDQRLSLVITANTIKDDEGNIIGFEGIAKDITRIKQVMSSLLQAEKMISVGQLAAGVAHEINTPLGIILGYTQLLEEDLSDNKEVVETLNIIEKQTKVCKRIVADLLKFSRAKNKEQDDLIDINRSLEDVLSIIEHSLNMNQIYVHRAFASDLPAVIGNQEKLQQVFLNIITNAQHAIERDGTISISTKLLKNIDKIEIQIADSGPGIPPEIIKKIFDAFFSTKGVGKGTGLGLSLCVDIIKEHNGELFAISPPDDKNLIDIGMRTVFKIILPIKES
jgi:PAS domain S-box-containing protein